MEMSGQLHSVLFYIGERVRYPLIRGWVGLRSDLDTVVKRRPAHSFDISAG
jgi:hypothetical protein